MWNYPDEDAFWESRRVEMESMFYSTENEPEEKSIYVDEELDELEAKYGCSMDELPEGDMDEMTKEILNFFEESGRIKKTLSVIAAQCQLSRRRELLNALTL